MRAAAVVVAVCVWVTAVSAQTAVKPPKKRYTQQDVELGRKGAAEVRQKFPIIEDEGITRYLARFGDRLVPAAPPELKESIYSTRLGTVWRHSVQAHEPPRSRTHRHSQGRGGNS